jgi:Anti-sigma factor NepR
MAQLLALKGDESLSGTSKANGGRSKSGPGSPDKGRKDRRGTIGRALRTVYDDMLREEVPKDFLDLLRKLD